jgi:hypothetical protein
MSAIPSTGNALQDAKDLGKGLMRGNRAKFKLGYTWENALIACHERYELSSPEKAELSTYLAGFARGISGQEGLGPFTEGVRDGLEEYATGRLNPA